MIKEKVSLSSQIKEVWMYRWLLLRPLFIASSFAFAWSSLYRSPFYKIISVSQNDKSAFEVLIAIIAAAHAYIAAMQILKVNDQQQKIQIAIKLKDEKMFRENEIARINPIIKLLLFVFSIMFFIIFIFYPFTTIYAGIIIVTITMFVLFLLWEVATELDDPYHGMWKLTKEKIIEAFSKDISSGGNNGS